jgi:hypothetical protein
MMSKRVTRVPDEKGKDFKFFGGFFSLYYPRQHPVLNLTHYFYSISISAMPQTIPDGGGSDSESVGIGM